MKKESTIVFKEEKNEAKKSRSTMINSNDTAVFRVKIEINHSVIKCCFVFFLLQRFKRIFGGFEYQLLFKSA